MVSKMGKSGRSLWQQERAPVNEHLPFSCEGSTSSGFYYAGSSSSSINADGRAGSSSSSHSQAEKRRRERINGHLSTLRRLIPNASKLDKGSLLGAVVERVKELRRKAHEVNWTFKLPTELDEVNVESNPCGTRLTVSICCDDRSDLFVDLSESLHGLKLRTVGADVTTVDGRIRSTFVINVGDEQSTVCLSSLKNAIQAVLGRFISPSWSTTGSFSLKRQRMLYLRKQTWDECK